MKKLTTLLLALLISANGVAFATPKRDVADPALREIITQLQPRMPRFIDKYGANVFVADEPITRGSLLSALYEFDAKTRVQQGQAASAISRQEFDALRTRLVAVENRAPASAAAGRAASAQVDVIALVNELQPNMPMLLDASLNNSRVFQELRTQVAAGGTAGDGAGVSQAAVSDINARIASLNQKVDNLAAANVQGAAGARQPTQREIADIQNSLAALSARIAEFERSGVAGATPSNIARMREMDAQIADIRNTVANVPTSRDIDRLERRLNTITPAKGGAAASSPEGDSSNTATIAKISLGITMVAALFVAR